MSDQEGENAGVEIVKRCFQCNENNPIDAVICKQPDCGSKEFWGKPEELLKNPKLFRICMREVEKKVVGQEKQRDAIFLFSCGRVVKNCEDTTTALLINAPPSQGKDHLCRNVLKLWPEACVMRIRSGTSEIFKYFGSDKEAFTWSGKIAHIQDIGEHLLNSQSMRTLLSDEGAAWVVEKEKGKYGVREINVRGRPIMFITTAYAVPNEEILARLFIMMLDKSKEQVRRVLELQARKFSGEKLPNQEYNSLVLRALELLNPVEVVVPYAAELLPFLSEDARILRDYPRYVYFIQASAALHQKQRKIDGQGRVIAQQEDYLLARRAIGALQSGAFVDMSMATRRVYDAITKYVTDQLTEALKETPQRTLPIADVRFTVGQVHYAQPVCNLGQFYHHFGMLLEKGLIKGKETTAGNLAGGRPVTEYWLADAEDAATLSLPDNVNMEDSK